MRQTDRVVDIDILVPFHDNVLSAAGQEAGGKLKAPSAESYRPATSTETYGFIWTSSLFYHLEYEIARRKTETPNQWGDFPVVATFRS